MKIEVRNNSVVIDGYVNVVGRESRTLRDVQGNFIEVIAPKTFQRALDKGADVGLMFNHKRDINHGEMKLYEDNIGLRCSVEVNDDEVIQKAQNGELRGWSFGFNCLSDEWSTSGEIRKRTINELNLIEVSILDCTPAYIATSVEMRGEDCELIEHRQYECDDIEVIDNREDEQQQEEVRCSDVLEQLNMKKKRFEFEFNFK